MLFTSLKKVVSQPSLAMSQAPFRRKLTYWLAPDQLHPGTPNIHELKWLFQLDDEPNLYLGNGCFTKHPLKDGRLRFQDDATSIKDGFKNTMAS